MLQETTEGAASDTRAAEGLFATKTGPTAAPLQSRASLLILIFVSSNDLEALSVHNAWATLVVLVLADPHLLERGQRRQNGSSNPHRVLPLGRGYNLNLDGRGGEGGDLLLQSLVDLLEHGGSSGQDSVGVQVTADVNITLHDGVVGELVHTLALLSDELRLEHRLRASDALDSNGDHLAVWELVVLLDIVAALGGGNLVLEVEGAVAELLLDISHDFSLGGGGERVSTLGQDLHEVVREVTAGQIQTEDSVGERVSLVDRHSVRHTVTGVHDDTGGTSRGVKRQDGLDGDVHGRGLEGLEHDLRHFLTVGLGVKWGLSEEDGVLLWRNTELVVEGVMPDLLHIIPRGHDSVLDGVLQEEDTSFGLGFVTDVCILLGHADHNTLVLGASHNGWEDRSRSVVTGKAGFDHSRPVVDNEGSRFIFVHGWLVERYETQKSF